MCTWKQRKDNKKEKGNNSSDGSTCLPKKKKDGSANDRLEIRGKLPVA